MSCQVCVCDHVPIPTLAVPTALALSLSLSLTRTTPATVRHNEDELNAQLAELLPWRVRHADWDSAHVKCFLLLQAHMAHVPLPISDYVNDTKSVLDQALRLMNVRTTRVCVL